MIPYDMRQATKEEIAALQYWHPSLELFFVTKEDQYMKAAEFFRNNDSTDKFHSTGAVVVKEGEIIGSAANQAGFKHPYFIRLHEKGYCIRKWLRIKSGTRYWLCPGCSKSKDHAETGATKDALKGSPEKVKGATLYLYGHWWCCEPCAKAMVDAGIRSVVLLENAKDTFTSSKGLPRDGK